MTTITVDEECLKNVDKLQSLLKLRYETLSGETITRGGAVNWAVNQQISAMTLPVNFINGDTCNQLTATSFNTNWQNEPGQSTPTMVAYMVTSTSASSPTLDRSSRKTHRVH